MGPQARTFWGAHETSLLFPSNSSHSNQVLALWVWEGNSAGGKGYLSSVYVFVCVCVQGDS